jgi:UDPglucose 6-dehydrogenase/GDP-mannose 6-dehydrogenase
VNICIIGAGYVGLVTGLCFAERGHHVTCVDSDPVKVDSIRRGVAPFHEAGLDHLLARNLDSRFYAQTRLDGVVSKADILFICVGTPFRRGYIDLSQVVNAAKQIGMALAHPTGYKVVVVKSTVIPGTTNGVVREKLEEASGLRVGKDFGLGMNPEFLTEGSAVADFMTPDRIVIGGIDKRSQKILSSVYAGWPEAPRILTNNSTAEMIKYTSNSVLATLISFSNEIARLCSAVGSVDVVDVLNGVHQSAYFSHQLPDGRRVVAPITSFLGAGCGFGGSCLPKDVSALAAQGKTYGLDMPLLSSVLEVNRCQPEHFVKLADKHYPNMVGVKVAVLGLAFKPDTDDIRESPALAIISLLKRRGAMIRVYDPVARPSGHPEMAGVELVASLVDAVRDAEIVFLITRWEEFMQLNSVLAGLGRDPLVVDGRRMLNPGDFKRFEGIGR